MSPDAGLIARLLQGTDLEPGISTLQPWPQDNPVPDVWRLDAGAVWYVVKLRRLRDASLPWMLHSLEVLHDPEALIHRPLVFCADNGPGASDGMHMVIASSGLRGKQPLGVDRHYLPDFFAALGRFNRHNPARGPFCTMYSDGFPFNTTEELVDAETAPLLALLGDSGCPSSVVDQVAQALGGLRSGMACLVLEDFHPGNLMVLPDGRFRVIDTDWLHPGLNLHQFDRLDWFSASPDHWANIRGSEARDCYGAYFDALGVAAPQASMQIRAWETLSYLRSLAVAPRDSIQPPELRIRLESILEGDFRC